MATDAAPTMTDHALGIPRRFTRPGIHPYDEVAWGPRDAIIVEPARDDRPERVVFEQTDCEFPLDWSDTAVRIVASKYFRYGMDDPRRERSLRQVIDRVVDTIHHHGVKGGYFADDDEAETFAQELRHILVTHTAAFNSPVCFNCGVSVAAREADDDRILDVDDPPIGADEPQVNQASAGFILSVNDTMPCLPRGGPPGRSPTRGRRSRAASPRSRRSSAAGRAPASTSRGCAATASPCRTAGRPRVRSASCAGPTRAPGRSSPAAAPAGPRRW
jgi:hypothetical protein